MVTGTDQHIEGQQGKEIKENRDGGSNRKQDNDNRKGEERYRQTVTWKGNKVPRNTGMDKWIKSNRKMALLKE